MMPLLRSLWCLRLPLLLLLLLLKPTQLRRRGNEKKSAIKGITEEGQILEETHPEQTRGPKATQSQQKRHVKVAETTLERHP